MRPPPIGPSPARLRRWENPMRNPTSILWRHLVLAISFAVVVCACRSEPTPDSHPARFEYRSLPMKFVGFSDFYPEQARRLGITGRVCLAYSVDVHGLARNVVVLESGKSILNRKAKELLHAERFDIPSDWLATDGPARRYRLGFIFQLSDKPKVPPFDADIVTVLITGEPIRRP